MKTKNLGILALLAVLAIGVLMSGCSNPSDHTPPPNTITPTPSSTPETWEMKEVWNVSTVGLPFMDMSPDGSLSAVVDWNNHIVYLVKPDGSSVSFHVQENDAVQPVTAGIVVKDGKAYVLGGYENFAGVRVYSWSGMVDELKHGGSGSVADDIMRSPNGNHMCYLVTVSPTEQTLVCDGTTVSLPNGYSIHWVSNTGLVILTKNDKSFVMKDGERVTTLNTPNVIAYGDRLIVSEGGTLKVLALNGDVLATRENAGFSQTTLLRWTLLPTGKYLFRHEPLEDTHVFTWNLSEVRTLPGFPYFASENFIVTAKNGVIHCYSLADFHEVFNVKVPGDSLGYIKLSDDGKVMLVSGETGDFYLYKGVRK